MLGEDAPPLSRGRLMRILALREDAPGYRVRREVRRLLARLESRLEAAETAAEREALELEITNLVTSADHWAEGDSLGDGRFDRAGLAGALLGALLMLVLLVAYAAGFRVSRIDRERLSVEIEESAELMLAGRLPGATLRVFDEDREELLLKLPAQDARIELAAGRYALDVSREDCPDRWTRSVFFEAGASHRFEPILCRGEGRVTVRSNVSGDRLLIDGFDVGGTGKTAHTVGVGDHDIRVEKKGFATFEGRVRVRPDEALEIRAELETEGKQAGRAAAPTPVPRPTPVSRQAAPSAPPVSPPSPEAFDMEGLRESIAPKEIGKARGKTLLRDGLGPMPDGGSSAWHDRVSRELLTRYDADGSGAIDQLVEAEAISCPMWVEIERDFDRGGLGLSMAKYYGFDGSEWHPRALGFSREYRSVAFERMKECGLST